MYNLGVCLLSEIKVQSSIHFLTMGKLVKLLSFDKYSASTILNISLTKENSFVFYDMKKTVF